MKEKTFYKTVKFTDDNNQTCIACFCFPYLSKKNFPVKLLKLFSYYSVNTFFITSTEVNSAVSIAFAGQVSISVVNSICNQLAENYYVDISDRLKG